ncbi:uncharacterized protein EDB91DRAFT_786767 [Suillus paluster]|uniref:uncharacterized protein n=1 Tax=Suillus paluster TaxID=48578 RepID=UPI001B8717C3|nr:uncharacterized protein EDB91DRAFT_786767 [Suillus paluster]KAG1730414.1 hypothetical protein EDB91DRAFT_786767 [Suillus paluster]
MDELVHHCLRELSFDGDLGCNVSRLRDFIVGFHSHDATHPQVVDDVFCAFVWSIVVQQPTVRVGTVPAGVSSEVYIAPQTSAKRKAAAKGEVLVEEAPPSLTLVENARARSLEDLKAEYGEDLRIAVDPETSFAAITGSHIRSSKLSPMVYSALQLITRGREEGITTVELGRKTKYDQKTCFYVIKQLLELGLIIKARRGGVGNHSCIHKYFVERSAFWQQIQQEEAKDDEPIVIGESHPQDGTPVEDGTPTGEPLELDFEPVDSRHLSSLPLIKKRIVKLLKASQNNIHASNNLMITIGFTNPTKTDRRFFQTRLRELIAQGVIERVLVPSSKVKDRLVKCIRLVTPDNQLPEGGVVLTPQEGEDDEKEVVFDDASAGHIEVRANRTIQKQVSDLLEEAGSSGRTLYEICGALGNFDKRTIELMLTRAAKSRPPAHLSDLGTADFMESFGRERRHRYYTLAAYKTVMASENLEDTTMSYVDIDLSKAGDFAVFNEAMFCDDDETLHYYEDTFKGKEGAKSKTGAKKRKREETEDPGDEEAVEDAPEPAPKAKRGRPRKILRAEEGGDVPTPAKRGRPRKQPIPEAGDATPTAPKVPKRRGRPPKRKPDAEQADSHAEVPTSEPMEGVSGPVLQPPVPSASPPVTGGDSPESRAMTSVATYRQRAASVTPHPVSKPPTSSPKEAGRSFQGPFDDHHHISQAVADANVQAAVPPPSAVIAVTTHVGDVVESRTGLVGVHVEETSPRRSRRKPKLREGDASSSQKRGAAISGIEVEGLPGDDSTDRMNESEVTPHVVDGAIVDGLPVTGHHPSAQDSMIIDPALLETSSADVTPVIGEKRKGSPPPVMASQPKRSRTSTPGDKLKGNPNISHLRRENEFFRVIQDLGGIANLHTKHFFDAHIALLNDMAQRGEPASAPSGTRIDKRTADATIKNMESRSRIKVLKTTVFSATGSTRPASLVYLPDTPQEKINAFLHDLSHSAPTPNVPPVKTFEEPVDFGAPSGVLQRTTLPLHLLQIETPGKDGGEHQVLDVAKAEELFSYDSETIRDVLLTERTTVAQLYGFRVGKAARLRDFHVFTLGLLEQHSSPRIVSHEHLMIDISLYQLDVPIAVYCSFIAVLSYDEELSTLMASAEGREILVRDLPSRISAKLQVGKSRSKSRVLELLDTLRLLGLVTPYEPSTDENADFRCTLPDGRTVAVRAASFEGWRVSTPSAAPQYWRFNETAPLYLWALSDSCPSYWRHVSVKSRCDGVAFWDELHKVSRDVAYARSTVCPTHGTLGPPANTLLVRFLRRRVSWDLEYHLTWHQKRYLDNSVDSATARSPLDEEDSDSRLQQICRVLSAPRAPVVAYLKEAAEKALREMKKARARQKRDEAEHHAKQNIEAKATLQQKAAEAKLHRENDWVALLQRLHPGPLKGTVGIRIRAVRNRFMQSSSIRDTGRWQSEIENAIREARLASNKVIARPKALTRPAALPPVVANPPEKSVHFLIAQQGPPILPQQIGKSRGKTKTKGDYGDQSEHKTPQQRRSRFHWTREYDELARDTSAVIRARCRGGVKIDLSAFDQVFPGVPRNSVRLRLSHLRENTGEEVYMKRLEDRWHDLWIQHRGTEHLPDEDPQSPSNFDIINHIEFLRQHVDKNALRVGYVEHTTRTKLPASVDDIIHHFNVLCNTTISPAWDFMWQATVEEGREKQFLRQSFTHGADDVPYVTNTSDDVVQVAEAALKVAVVCLTCPLASYYLFAFLQMVFGMPTEHYDADLSAKMLHSAGDQSVSLATSNLLRRGVLSKVVRDPKKMKPGRTLKISDINLNAIGGPIHGDLFQDAVALDEVFAEQVDSMEWPLLASDGDTAALLQLVSEEQVDFIIDMAQSRNARARLDWNSKKADDDDIETSIQVRLNALDGDDNEGNGSAVLPSYETRSDPTNMPLDESMQHGQTVTGAEAACTEQTQSRIIDCVSCIESTFSEFAARLDSEQQKLARNIFDGVRASLESGTSKSHYLTLGADDVVMDLLQRMSQTSPPLIMWAGYSAPVIVSCLYARPWTVEIVREPKTLALPRRWLDIRGGTIRDVWNAALHAVVGIIFFHPGISQTELRWKLRAVCDRQELVDIMCFLYREEAIHARFGTDLCPTGPMWPATLDDGEEQQVYWFIGKIKYWYQV